MSASDRPLRADAQRNRNRLVAVATAAFAADDATVPLEDIARRAGVGIGTLYRHFPTREALVEAVYATELDEITRSAAVLLEQLPPDAALRAWMDRYAQFAELKRGLVDTLRAGWAAGRIATPATRERITAAIATILTAGAGTGAFREDIDPDDITALLLGVFLSTAPHAAPNSGSSKDQIGRLLDLVLDSLRGTARPTAAATRRSEERPMTRPAWTEADAG